MLSKLRKEEIFKCRLQSILFLSFFALLSNLLINDLKNSIISSPENNSNQRLTAWASWIGEIPTAAEVYGDASSDSPSAEGFDDDDEDEELDASASNEYPDYESDEGYDDPEENPDNAESQRLERWLLPSQRTRRHAFWSDMEEGARKRRDIEDRIVLASRRANRHNKANENSDELDYNSNEDDVDAWVHDGIDDIHIDPETKRAASENSYDEKSIDSEYDPKEQPANRTRVTTIAEVIPMVDDSEGSSSASTVQYLPAAHLSLEQLQSLVAANSPVVKTSRGVPSKQRKF